jgi:hypothetical protein
MRMHKVVNVARNPPFVVSMAQNILLLLPWPTAWLCLKGSPCDPPVLEDETEVPRNVRFEGGHGWTFSHHHGQRSWMVSQFFLQYVQQFHNNGQSPANEINVGHDVST